MTHNNPSYAAETEVLKGFYSALNSNDISRMLGFCDPQIERIEFEGTPSAGAYHGIAEVKAHFERARETWAEGSCEPERFQAVGDKIIVTAYVRVRLKNSSDWLEGRATDVFAFRGGKIIQFRTFAEAQQALDWAGYEFTCE